jgi:low affinity Fe/Cu permease
MPNQRLWFANFAQWVSHVTGRPITFLTAIAIILIWAAVGPFVGYSDTWQLVINTATTIITFLMVFVIQNTQNRDTAAMHIKIDELIRVTGKARNVLLDLEELDEKTLEELRTDYEKLARKAKSRTRMPLLNDQRRHPCVHPFARYPPHRPRDPRQCGCARTGLDATQPGR